MVELTFLAEKMRLRTFATGDVLVREGDEGEEFFLLRDGQVDVFKHANGPDHPVVQLERGQCFGERALLSGEKRAATIVAKTSGALYSLSKLEFNTAIEASPNFRTQLQNLYFNR